MANEIKVLSVANGGEDQRFSLLFYYSIPLAQRIEDPLTPGTPFIVNPTADMDAETLSLLSAGEISALDAGEAVLHSTTLKVAAGTSGAAVLALAQSRYSQLQSYALAIYQNRYTHAHKQFDAA